MYLFIGCKNHLIMTDFKMNFICCSSRDVNLYQISENLILHFCASTKLCIHPATQANSLKTIDFSCAINHQRHSSLLSFQDKLSYTTFFFLEWSIPFFIRTPESRCLNFASMPFSLLSGKLTFERSK